MLQSSQLWGQTTLLIFLKKKKKNSTQELFTYNSEQRNQITRHQKVYILSVIACNLYWIAPWGGQAYGLRGSKVNMCRWPAMTVQQAKRKGSRTPFCPLYFLRRRTKRRRPSHIDLLKDRRRRSGGWGRRSFIKDRNIHKNLLSRLLSAERGAGAQDRRHRCHCETRPNKTSQWGNKKKKKNLEESRATVSVSAGWMTCCSAEWPEEHDPLCRSFPAAWSSTQIKPYQKH